jgi:nitrogen fixation/metabolism regulation signal transduction histidine kinase
MNQSELLNKIYWISSFLVILILAFLVSVIFLNPSSVGNKDFLWFFNLWAFVWAVIFILVLVLSFVLARNLIRLFFEYQARHPGSRIKTKLVVTFVIFSLFPSLIMFFLAFGLVNQNLTKWVSAPSEQLLNSSRVIAEDFYEEKRKSVIAGAERIAHMLSRDPEVAVEMTEEMVRDEGFTGVSLVGLDGRPLLALGEFPDGLAVFAEEVPKGGVFYSLDKGVNLYPGIVDRGLVGMHLADAESGEIKATLLVTFAVPRSIAYHVERVREAGEVYKGLKGTLASLRFNYFSILGLTTLTVVFGFVWMGSYIARKLTVPLEALAEGSREIAEGNLDHRVDVMAVDELGILVESFNRMARQLQENRSELEKANQTLKKTNVRLDERRRYIETILQNIATGVLTVDDENVIRTVNEAALKMLQTGRDQILNRDIEAVADKELFTEFTEMKKRARLYGTCRKQITFQRNERQLFVAANMTANPVGLSDEFEYLVVLDDLTELIRAEKFAAWQEVARRLAHEIKNPLTPIQLSAERVKKRFEKISSTLPNSPAFADFGKMLGDATRMIVAESRMLKALLAEFSSFARLPISKPRRVRLHDLIEKTLTLYDGSLDAISVKREFDPKIGSVMADPDQMQRVFMNLIDNSMDALVEEEQNRGMLIRTAFNESRGSVTIEFQDTGPGIPADDYEQLFLPYFSTKRKGTGLGLAIVRQIVTEHNGFIRAEPNEPKGTRIILEIPVK